MEALVGDAQQCGEAASGIEIGTVSRKKMVTAIFTAIYVNDLERSKAFYCDLLALTPVFESDWIIQVASPIDESINLTLQPRNRDLVPEGLRHSPQGV